jgi:hypothetical protein
MVGRVQQPADLGFTIINETVRDNVGDGGGVPPPSASDLCLLRGPRIRGIPYRVRVRWNHS